MLLWHVKVIKKLPWHLGSANPLYILLCTAIVWLRVLPIADTNACVWYTWFESWFYKNYKYVKNVKLTTIYKQIVTSQIVMIGMNLLRFNYIYLNSYSEYFTLQRYSASNKIQIHKTTYAHIYMNTNLLAFCAHTPFPITFKHYITMSLNEWGIYNQRVLTANNDR